MVKYTSIKKAKRFPKKYTLILLFVSITFISVACFILYQKDSRRERSADQPGVTDGSGLNLNPPSKEELTRSDEEKLNRLEVSSGSSVSQDGNPVRIQEAYYDKSLRQIVVKTELYGSAWVNCRLTVTKSSVNITRTAEVKYQQPYSSCVGFAISDERLSPGEWDIKLEGIDTSGKTKASDPRKVEVQL